MAENHASRESGICELFAAANSGEGFRSFYSEIFGDDRIERRYLIKGGPGTGKSSFMRRIAELSSQKGIEVEYYRCSSDPDSLDGIILGKRIALFDSTAPHSFEPELSGARDEIIDLGVFWDSEALCRERQRIEELSLKKKDGYAGAYRFLGAALAVAEHSRSIIAPYVSAEKMKKAVRRELGGMPDGERYSLRAGLSSSIGMKGMKRLDYYERVADELVAIEDHMGIGCLYLCRLAEEAARKKKAIRISYDPIAADLPDAILFEEGLVAYVLVPREGQSDIFDRADRRVRCRRFLDMSELGSREKKRLKSEYRSSQKLYGALCDSAVECMRRAGEQHFELEKIYGAAMDFSAESRFCRSMAERICGYLEQSPDGGAGEPRS